MANCPNGRLAYAFVLPLRGYYRSVVLPEPVLEVFAGYEVAAEVASVEAESGSIWQRDCQEDVWLCCGPEDVRLDLDRLFRQVAA